MPEILEFKTKVVIYFKGDKTTRFYVLKRGRVILTSYLDKELREEEIGPGNFFGTQAVLAGHAQDETAMASIPCEVIAFSREEFETLAFNNGTIVLKMLKSFSGQLTAIHTKVSNLLVEQDDLPIDRDFNLFHVGHYFLNNRTYKQAAAAFERYLVSYPSGKNAKEAERQMAYAISKINSSDDLSSESFRNQNIQEAVERSPMQMEYDESMILFNQKKHPQAFVRFTKLMNMTSDPMYNALAGNCYYYLGETLMQLEKYDDACTHFIDFTQKFPDHEGVHKALFFAATAYEKLGNNETSLFYFTKLLEVLPSHSPMRERIAKKMEKF